MSIQDDSPSQGPDDPPRFCTNCGATLATTDQFCPECGADIARQQAQHAAATAEDASEPEIAPVQIPESGQHVSRRKRRRRPWYRRPLFVIPIALVIVL
ncbi:MAG TPA: zinc-ribbon domain-containing protein, partial [Thermomicrobiales bacterium]|nr:zinc-ribbon domain-containing protein [Thermomicrobiales bacterium]